MRLSRLVTGGAIAAVLTGTAACGLQAVEPKLELRDAASDFSNARTGALRLSLPSSVADVRAFATQADTEDTSSSGDQGSDGADTAMSDADLQQLTSAHVDLAYDKGADAANPADDAGRALVHIGKVDAAEVRSVGQVVYARVDVDGLVGEFPDMKEGVDQARSALTATSGQEAAPESVRAPAQALLDGKWVSLDDRKGSWLDQQLTAPAAGSTGSPAGGLPGGLPGGLATDAPARLQALAGKAFGDGVVTVKRLDSDDRLGDHLVATANLRTIWRNIRGDVPGLFTGQAATQLQDELPAVEEAPDRDLAVSFWVHDGKLTRVELDAAQFLRTPAGHLLLRVDVLAPQAIAAPAGAVPVDLQKISEETGESVGGILSGSGGADGPVDARTAATWVDEDLRGMADEDGVAPSLSYLPRVRQDFADMEPEVTIAQVGKRIQVTVNGTSACLKPATTTAADGTVTDGRC